MSHYNGEDTAFVSITVIDRLIELFRALAADIPGDPVLDGWDAHEGVFRLAGASSDRGMRAPDRGAMGLRPGAQRGPSAGVR